jgi:hypothetical protein
MKKSIQLIALVAVALLSSVVERKTRLQLKR